MKKWLFKLFEHLRNHHCVLFAVKRFPEVGLCVLTVTEERGDMHKAPGGTNRDHLSESPYETMKRKAQEEAGVTLIKAKLFFKEKKDQHKKFYYVAETYAKKSFNFDDRLSNGNGITAHWLPIRTFAGKGLLPTQQLPFATFVLKVLAHDKNFGKEYADLIHDQERRFGTLPRFERWVDTVMS